jgi:hypothetical protein
MALAVAAKTGVAVSESQVHVHGWHSSVNTEAEQRTWTQKRDRPARASLIFIRIEIEALR